MRTPIKHGQTRCAIFLDGWKISQRILWTTKFGHPETHPQALLVNWKQQRQKKWYWENPVLIVTSRRTDIAKYARRPSSQELLAGNALAEPYLVQKDLVCDGLPSFRHFCHLSCFALRHCHSPRSCQMHDICRAFFLILVWLQGQPASLH